jgi:hypothetical protein
VSTRQSTKTATESSNPKIGNSSVETKYPWHHSVDKKNCFLHVKFEVRFAIPLARKSRVQEKVTFFMGDGPCFFSKMGVFKKFGNI